MKKGITTFFIIKFIKIDKDIKDLIFEKSRVYPALVSELAETKVFTTNLLNEINLQTIIVEKNLFFRYNISIFYKL